MDASVYKDYLFFVPEKCLVRHLKTSIMMLGTFNKVTEVIEERNPTHIICP